jgi:endonuclease/exonuclease/phosphatase family metal-dependent hydrolase
MKRVILTFLVALVALSVSAQELNVASFNIRNGAPLKEGKERPTKGKSDYVKYNGWDDRKQILCDMINFEAFDIFGSQEVRKGQLDDMLAMLPDYDYVGVGRDHGDDRGEFSPIFYRRDVLEKLDGGTFWLSDTPDVPSRVETSTLDRIATWALLKDLRTGEEILFVNTHFEHTSEAARTDQAYILQEYLIEMVGEYPTYVTGDFNTSTDSVMYMAMTDLLGDAMADATENASEVDYTFHAYEAGEQYREYIDFIFYSDEGRAPAFARILTEQYGGFVSDHYGVFAIFPKA